VAWGFKFLEWKRGRAREWEKKVVPGKEKAAW
jgi:hypothetical protein